MAQTAMYRAPVPNSTHTHNPAAQACTWLCSGVRFWSVSHFFSIVLLPFAAHYSAAMTSSKTPQHKTEETKMTINTRKGLDFKIRNLSHTKYKTAATAAITI